MCDKRFERDVLHATFIYSVISKRTGRRNTAVVPNCNLQTRENPLVAQWVFDFQSSTVK